MKKLYLVGLGPGCAEQITPQAAAALERSDVLCGYTTYIDLVRPLYPDKEIYTTPMTRELERCQWALEAAKQGRTVAMICSGDAGVYGMAGPVLQLSVNDPDVEVEVVPGITAALSGAAVLGAPLMNDFCVISLSDLLTPWEQIEHRLIYAAQGDFVICIYNPCSKKRREHLKNACTILMRAGKSPDTVCGWVQNIGRAGTRYEVCSLSSLCGADLDMFTTVFIGNRQTYSIQGRMVTPRGYERK